MTQITVDLGDSQSIHNDNLVQRGRTGTRPPLTPSLISKVEIRRIYSGKVKSTSKVIQPLKSYTSDYRKGANIVDVEVKKNSQYFINYFKHSPLNLIHKYLFCSVDGIPPSSLFSLLRLHLITRSIEVYHSKKSVSSKSP